MALKPDSIIKLEQKIVILEKGLADIRLELENLKIPESKMVAHSKQKLKPQPAPTIESAAIKKPTLWQKARSADLELLFGGNILGKLGALSVIIALGWFIKYAFDNQWVNESGRIFSGMLLSSIPGFAGIWLAQKNYRVVPQLLLGTSLTGFVVTMYMAWYLYGLINTNETFLYLFILFAMGILLSSRFRSQSLFIFSILGAFALPPLFSKGENSYIFLFSYITLINVSYFYLGNLFRWKFSGYLLLALTCITWILWSYSYVHITGYLIPLIFLLINFGIHFFLQLKSVITFPMEHPAHRIVSFLTAITTFSLLLVFYQGEHFPSYETHILFIPAFILFFTVRYVAKIPNRARSVNFFASGNLILATYLGFAILTLYFTGSDLSLALICLASFFLFMSLKYASAFLYYSSLPLLLIAFLKLVVTSDTTEESYVIWNFRFGNFLLLAGFSAFLQKTMVPEFKRMPGRIPGIIALLSLIIGSLEQAKLGISNEHYVNLSYSYILAGYSALFLFIGFRHKMHYFRIAGFTLACIVVTKLYLYDIWQLSKLVRIIAGLTLGAGLIILSAMYQKFKDSIFKNKVTPRMMWILAVIALGWTAARPLSAESIKGYHFMKQAQTNEIFAGSEYGSFRVDEEMYRHSSDWDVRLFYKGKLVPFMYSSEMEKKAGAKKIIPRIIFKKTERNTQVIMIRLGNIPAGAKIEKLHFLKSGNFESLVKYYVGSKADTMRYAGEKKLFRYDDSHDLSLNIFESNIGFIRIESKDAFDLIPVSADTGSVSESVEYKQTIPVNNLKIFQQKDAKQTVVYFENPDRRKISSIRVEFSDKKFRRRILIYEQLDNRSKYRLSTTSTVEKRKEFPNEGILEINFSGSRSRKLKMVIENDDNDPLTISKFEIKSLSEIIIFALPEKFTPKENKIDVYYGNKYASPPRFDITSSYNARSEIVEFRLSAQSQNSKYGFSITEPPVSSWIIRITFYLLLTLLVWYAVKTMRKFLGREAVNL